MKAGPDIADGFLCRLSRSAGATDDEHPQCLRKRGRVLSKAVDAERVDQAA
jgi:hypothetical protein